MHAAWRLSLAIHVATIELKLYNFIQAFERRYSPDQPRVPAGNPDGGQWTGPAGGSGRSATRGRGRANKPLRTALAGVLIMQRVGVGDDRLIRHCVYEDMFMRQRTREIDATQNCPRTLKFPPYEGAP